MENTSHEAVASCITACSKCILSKLLGFCLICKTREHLLRKLGLLWPIMALANFHASDNAGSNTTIGQSQTSAGEAAL